MHIKAMQYKYNPHMKYPIYTIIMLMIINNIRSTAQFKAICKIIHTYVL